MDRALAVGAFGRIGGGFEASPEVLGEGLDFLVAGGIAREARGFERRIPDDGGAGFHEVADFDEQGWGHCLNLRQNHHAVRSSAGERDQAVLHLPALEEHPWRAAIKAVAFFVFVETCSLQHALWRQENVRRTLGGEVKHIGDRGALAKNLGAPREVVVVGTDHRPPSLVAVPINSIRPEGEARPVVWAQRLVRIGVEEDPVDAYSKRPVSLVFHRCGIDIHAAHRCERLGSHDGFPHHMGDGGRLDDAVGRIKHVLPKLPHRNIRHRAQVEVPGRIHVVGLDREFEPVLMGIRFHDLGVILEHQILSGETHIPEETLALLHPLHGASGIGQKERLGIIATSFFKLLEERRRPVLRAGFPAIHVQIRQPVLLRARADFFQQGADEFGEVEIDRLCIELVGLASLGRARSWSSACAIDAAAHTNHRPISGRHFPVERAVGFQVLRQVHDLVGGDDARRSRLCVVDGGRQVGFHLFPRRVGLALVKRLLVDVGNHRIGTGERIHREILVKRMPHREEWLLALIWHGELLGNLLRSLEIHRAEDQMLHGILRLDPRPAASAPTRPDAQIHIDPQALRVAHHLDKCILPRLGHPLHRPLWNSQVHLEEKHLIDADLFHVLQLGRHLLRVQIAVIEIPINARHRRVRRFVEALLESLLGSKRAHEHESEKECRFFSHGKGLTALSKCSPGQGGRRHVRVDHRFLVDCIY